MIMEVVEFSFPLKLYIFLLSGPTLRLSPYVGLLALRAFVSFSFQGLRFAYPWLPSSCPYGAAQGICFILLPRPSGTPSKRRGIGVARSQLLTANC